MFHAIFGRAWYGGHRLDTCLISILTFICHLIFIAPPFPLHVRMIESPLHRSLQVAIEGRNRVGVVCASNLDIRLHPSSLSPIDFTWIDQKNASFSIAFPAMLDLKGENVRLER